MEDPNIGVIYGGNQQIPCLGGCIFALDTESVDQCKALCRSFNTGNLNEGGSYTVGCEEHYWPAGHVRFGACQDLCGCPAGVSREKEWKVGETGACYKGCELAGSLRTGAPFYGRTVQASETGDDATDTATLSTAFQAIKTHIAGTTVSTASTINTMVDRIMLHQGLIARTNTMILKALDLVDQYETSQGGVGIFNYNRRQFPRNPPTAGDEFFLERAMVKVSLAVIDLYQTKGVLAACSKSVFQGRKWRQAEWFPGAVTPPGSDVELTSKEIWGTRPMRWGHQPIYFDRWKRAPTGIYLPPGEIAILKVEQALLDKIENYYSNTTMKFQLQVGHANANLTRDYSSQGVGISYEYTRVDRITTTYNIESTETYIGNPLGGGIYICIPYPAEIGAFTVKVAGKVVYSPYFRK